MCLTVRVGVGVCEERCRWSVETGDDSVDSLLVRKQSACLVEDVDGKRVLLVGGDGQQQYYL